MHIFIYEHVVGGGSAGAPLPHALTREGFAMLESIVRDITISGAASGAITLDDRFKLRSPPPNLEVFRVKTPAEASERFEALARECDGVLVIAPELGGELARASRRVLDAGGRLLGSGPDTIEVAADKLLLPRVLAAKGVPCVLAAPFEEAGPLPFELPVVVKPKQGAGSTDVRLVRNAEALPAPAKGAIVTPYMRGLPVSVLVLAGRHRVLPMRACEQVLSRDGKFRYLGGRLPLSPEFDARARGLALRAVGALPGLRGFAGVDMVLDRVRPKHPQDVVIEVNARMTTSYVGVRALADANLAELWLEILRGGAPPDPPWRDLHLRFHPDGTLDENARPQETLDEDQNAS